jgi:hypothetical protein
VIVANVAAQQAQKGASTLSQEGLVPQPKNVFAPSKPGTVVGTDPVAGTKTTKGADVTVLISVGYPNLAYDTGGQTPNIVMANGGTGKKITDITKAGTNFTDPTWSSDGKTLVFRSATGQLFAIDTTKKDAVPQPITPTSDNFHDPTFAPGAQANGLIAMIRRTKPDGDLCLARLNGTAQLQPNCIDDPHFDLGNRIAWSPDGKTILVPGVQLPLPTDPNAPTTFGLVLYKSSVPFSADPANWGQGKAVTDITKPGQGVRDAAYAPNGKQIAIVDNLDNTNGNFQVELIKPTDFFRTKAKSLGVSACDVSWRPDGGELLIEVGQQGCSASSYAIARLDPAKPKAATTLVPQGLDPAWQPLSVATALPFTNQQPSP